MFNYAEGYRKLCQSSLQQEQDFIANNIESYPLLEKILGFTFSFQEILNPFYEKVGRNLKKPMHMHVNDKMMTDISIAGMCISNLHSIWHAIRPLEQNSIHNCSNIIRPVYESVPKSFYMLYHPEKVWEITLREEFGTWLSERLYYEEINQIGIAKGFEQRCPNANADKWKYLYFKCYITHNPKGKIYQKRSRIRRSKTSYDEFKGKYNNNWFREKIYTGKSLAMQDYFYAILSKSSHANIIRAVDPIEYDTIQSPRFFKILTDLAFFNLFILFNSCYYVIDYCGIEKTMQFIKDVHQELSSFYELTYLYPDYPKYLKDLKPRPVKE